MFTSPFIKNYRKNLVILYIGRKDRYFNYFSFDYFTTICAKITFLN
jgi:hypothetical protein